MSHGVSFFVWRNGRPRWCPSPAVRANGFKARDLKDGHGAFLPLDAALDMARALNARAGVAARPATVDMHGAFTPDPEFQDDAHRNRAKGWVYFLWFGHQVKIGFSRNPFARANTMMTGFATPIQTLTAVRGTMADEKYLHYRLRRDRLEGEWFNASRDVIWLMLRCIRSRRVVRTQKDDQSHGVTDELAVSPAN